MNSIYPGEALYRPRLLTILHTAMAIGETRFTRRLALAWLAAYPGDIPVNILNARALIEEKHPLQAIEILEDICLIDVECLQALETLRMAHELSGKPPSPEMIGAQYALGGKPSRDEPIPDWAIHLRGSRQAKRLGFLERANELIQLAQACNPDNSLIAQTHLQIFSIRATPTNASLQKHIEVSSQTQNTVSSSLAIRSIAEAYHVRWPKCQQISLQYAQALIDCNEDETAVSLIHQSVSQDITGQVALRLWGPDHVYKSMWPKKLSITHDQPIPASVAASLGWNQLPKTATSIHLKYHNRLATQKGEKVFVEPTNPINIKDEQDITSLRSVSTDQYSTETLRSVHDELNRLATRLRQPSLSQNDGRFPIYVIFTTHSGLVAQYGTTGSTAIEIEIKHLDKALQGEKQWGGLQFFADQGIYDIPPAKPNDPWSLKLALVDLDQALAQRGERIGAVLIVGGPQVVPFHHLPNPVDDNDVDVPSDNPYGTRDENYFIPEWPVGRLPGDSTEDPTPLIKEIKNITLRHETLVKSKPWYINWWRIITKLIKGFKKNRQPSIGYTAAIWRRASLAVFRPIGDGRALKVSPPVEGVKGKTWSTGSIGYFNLHGLIDSPEWYGQKDSSEENSGPDYPVVLRPSDVVNSGRSPEIIFSEACYGTHIFDRSLEQALSLKFLASGSQAVIGSTCTSYGSVSMPLIAADLLGRSFWKYIKEGNSVGEALRRAKVALAREMNNRQGYLDGEDQKTLISFVLYGDPLSVPVLIVPASEKQILRSYKSPTPPKIVCDRYDPGCGQSTIPPETLAQVKSIVAQYLPGM